VFYHPVWSRRRFAFAGGSYPPEHPFLRSLKKEYSVTAFLSPSSLEPSPTPSAYNLFQYWTPFLGRDWLGNWFVCMPINTLKVLGSSPNDLVFPIRYVHCLCKPSLLLGKAFWSPNSGEVTYESLCSMLVKSMAGSRWDCPTVSVSRYKTSWYYSPLRESNPTQYFRTQENREMHPNTNYPCTLANCRSPPVDLCLWGRISFNQLYREQLYPYRGIHTARFSNTPL